MLDPQLDGPARDALAQDARGQIEASGTLKHDNSWGLRKMAYEINRRTEADYRWMRFEAPSELLDSLDHNLKIADGVLRFRIFKVDPDAPVVVPPSTTATPGPRERSGQGGRDESREESVEAEDSIEAPEESSAPSEPSGEPAPAAEPAVESANEPTSVEEPAPAAAPAAEGSGDADASDDAE
jgi:small subunit ribosomal protein S6